MLRSSLWALVFSFGLLLNATAADDEDYIRVEMRGQLQTDIVAIGGETTGTILQAGKVAWELDLRGDQELIAAAKKLSGKRAIVVGRYTERPGVEIPVRRIVEVMTIKPAAAR